MTKENFCSLVNSFSKLFKAKIDLQIARCKLRRWLRRRWGLPWMGKRWLSARRSDLRRDWQGFGEFHKKYFWNWKTFEFVTASRYLRESLHLTGTKISCGQGGCGSCLVTAKVSHFSLPSQNHYCHLFCIFIFTLIFVDLILSLHWCQRLTIIIVTLHTFRFLRFPIQQLGWRRSELSTLWVCKPQNWVEYLISREKKSCIYISIQVSGSCVGL